MEQNKFEKKVLNFWNAVVCDYQKLADEVDSVNGLDYYVFQTAYHFQPDLMIVGVNPGGDGKNGNGWLCPPEKRNMYIEGDHSWFVRLRDIFGYPMNETLKPCLENCVGANNIFLNTGTQDKLPKSPLLNGKLIRELVFNIIQPRAIVAFGRIPYHNLRTTKSTIKIMGRVNLESAMANDIPILYIPNPSPRNNSYFSDNKIEEWQQVLEEFLTELS